MASRFALRVISRRNFFTGMVRRNIAEEYLTEEKHAEGTMKTWKLVSMFVAVPALAVCSYNAYSKEVEHHEAHPEPPDFVAYSHLRIRSKSKGIHYADTYVSSAFPWGDGNHSLFHNPHANALPDGYEEHH